MKLRQPALRLLTLLSILLSVQQPLRGSHHESDQKDVKCLLKHINERTKCDLHIDKEILGIVSCGDPIHITQEDVRNGLVITEPGVYKFCSDIAFEPPSTNSAFAAQGLLASDIDDATIQAIKDLAAQYPAFGPFVNELKATYPDLFGSQNVSKTALASSNPIAIKITCSNVVLDLNNFRLLQNNTTSGAVGIELAPGIDNVTIKNGTIEYFTGAAIHSFIPESDPQPVTSKLSFLNLNLINNSPGGKSNGAKSATGLCLDCFENTFSNDQPSNFVYENVIVAGCNINKNGINATIFNNVDNLSIDNTHVDDTFAEGGFFFKISSMWLANSQNVSISDSSFNNLNNGESHPFSVFAVSHAHVSNQNVVIKNCELNSPNIVGGIFACSSVGAQETGYLWENCQFNGLTSINCGLPNIWHCSDLAPSVGSASATFKNCKFQNAVNTGGTEFMCGLLCLDIDNLVIEDCAFSKIINNGSGNTFGIYYQAHSADVANLDVENMECCRIKNTTIYDIEGEGKVAGIMFLDFTLPPYQSNTNPVLTNVSIEQTDISKIHTSSASMFAAGIIVRDGIVDIVPPPNPPVFPFITRNLFISDCKISDVQRTVAGSTGNVAGIYLDFVTNPVLQNNSIVDANIGILFTSNADTGDTKNGLVQGNRVTNCSVAGYRDTSATTTSAWVQNVSYLNGVAYDINFGGPAPVQTGYTGSNAWFNIELP